MRLWKRRGLQPGAFSAFGVSVQLELEDWELWPMVEEILPPGRTACDPSAASERFGLRTSGSDTYMVTVGDTSWIEHAELDVAINALDQQLRLFIAGNAAGLIFVHAGVVAVHGRALVIPGESFTGKTTLVRALVESGATYYSDEYAVIDSEGRVHPYARRLSIRSEEGVALREADVGEFGGLSAEVSAELALVVITRYRAGAAWRPEPLSSGEGVVALLANAVPAQQRPRESLQALGRAVRGARILKGDRGEARTVASPVLAELSAETP